ncbi:unnamed protein product, partial [Polarella glacialis]
MKGKASCQGKTSGKSPSGADEWPSLASAKGTGNKGNHHAPQPSAGLPDSSATALQQEQRPQMPLAKATEDVGEAGCENMSLLELAKPAASFGTQGKLIQLQANHFRLTVALAYRGKTVWRAWQVEFTPQLRESAARVGPGKAGKGKGKGKAPREPREPPSAVRRAAMTEVLQIMDAGSWLYDGSHRLYTRKGVPGALEGKYPLEVAPGESGGRRPFVTEVCVTPACGSDGKQQEIDLAWLSEPHKHGQDPMAAIAEQRRFIQVAIRRFALDAAELLACGRRVLCPRSQLLGEQTLPLLHGRELWWGYLAQVEVVDGGKMPMCTLSLNLVASVGIPEMPALHLVAKLLAESQRRNTSWSHEEWVQHFKDELDKRWPKELDNRMLQTLNSETGLRKVKVSASYPGYTLKEIIYGITEQPADRLRFECKEEGGQITVADYFQRKYQITLKRPFLPCLQLGNAMNCVPMELVTILGGEHNISAGRLHPDYQQQVTLATAMPPGNRQQKIEKLMSNTSIGPLQTLKDKGLNVETDMLKVTGRVLQEPRLQHGGSGCLQVNNYSQHFKSVSPPDFQVDWGLWTLVPRCSQDEVGRFASQLKDAAGQHGMEFNDSSFCGWPTETWKVYADRKSKDSELEQAIRADLLNVPASVKLLVVLLPDSDLRTSKIYGLLKTITETELNRFVTQCINCSRGVSEANKKLNNLMLKICTKLPKKENSRGAAHNVQLMDPHRLLAKHRTMIMGADVTHNVAGGVSVAGVVASRDNHFVSYYSELRGQSPFDLNGSKTRRRKSEERVCDLTEMTATLLRRWKSGNNGALPDVILYYRDGVSDGQFVGVLTWELNCLSAAFKEVGGEGYAPKLVIIVGQKRHQTRFFKDEPSAGGSSQAKESGAIGKGMKGDVKGDKGKGGKGSGKAGDGKQVPPGTVASQGIAQPGHINFLMVSQKGIQGTSVPCHYHVLHLDTRLTQAGIGVNDVERITYDLCHIYSRADTTVGYASPAYLADHLCERGKLYLETHFGDVDDFASSSPGVTRSEEEQ